MSTVAQSIANLSPEKRRLLEHMLRRKGVAVDRSLILPQPRTDNRFPLSFAQQRLWFLSRLEPDSPYYNIPVALRIRGNVDIARFQQALNAVVARHETLRTTIQLVDGEAYQLIRPALELPLELEDLAALPAEQRESEMLARATAAARRSFDLASGPLLHAQLYRLDSAEHVLLLNMHHIISDGWSMGRLVDELVQHYLGQELPAPLSVQYADFAVWQRDWLGSVDDPEAPLHRQLAYWREQLGDLPPALELPTDRPRPALLSSAGATHSFRIEADLAEQLTELARRRQVSLFMLLLAAFQVLLHRYSGQDDLCVGTPIANRSRPEVEPLIGFFVNTLVLRANLAGNPAFDAFLEQLRATTLDAYEHQDLPFETLVEALQPARDPSRTPLFQVMFILQNRPIRPLQLPGLAIDPLEIGLGTSTFDLTLLMEETGDGLQALFEYSTELFDAATMERMSDHFRCLLAGIVADPAQAVGALPLISPAERRMLLALGRGPAATSPPASSLLELIEQHAARDPAAIAIIAGSEQISYGELLDHAGRLARRLLAAGLQTGDYVAIDLPYGSDLHVAVLAVWQAGGAYVPLDHNAPAARLAAILADAVPRLLIVEQACQRYSKTGAEQVALPATTRLIAIDEATEPGQENQLGVQTSAEQAAYLIYTSGSTGTPKGVVVEQRQLLNAYVAWEQAYALQPGQRHLQMASFSFDVFAGDLTRALGSGGTLVLCPREALLDPPVLAALMARERIACAEFVPVVLRGLMAQLEQRGASLPDLRILVCGSDSWYAGEYAAYQRLLGPAVRLINSFGLTEATIDSSYFEMHQPLALVADQVLPIGRPYANMQVYILDPAGEPSPIGVPGELYIGGSGVARGYHRQPELAATRFLADPFSPLPGARMYRSGDRARWLADGTIAYLGRADSQLKIRGFRVEPAEIEATLGRHPAVQQVAVAAKHAPDGENWLVAYLTVAGDQFAPEELRRFAQERLPHYMVPALFVLLAEMPLLPSGKIDRRALPAPDWAARQSDQAYVAPRSAAEQQLAQIWCELLGLERVGVYDDFFALGGHSLLATRLVARLRQACEVELPLRSVFAAPTLEDMAAALEAAEQQPVAAAIPPLRKLDPTGPLPLSFAQQRFWFIHQLDPASPLYNIPDAIRIRSELDIKILETALHTILARHSVLRASFIQEDQQPQMRLAAAIPNLLQVYDLREHPPAERESIARDLLMGAARQSFDLVNGPLLHTSLIRISDDDAFFLLVMHHSISDGWSGMIFVQELAELVAAQITGQAPRLPELPYQYADYAAWQRDWLQGAVLEQQLDYWRDQLAGVPSVLDLPTDRSRPAVQRFRGAHISFELAPELSVRLQELARREQATLFMLLLAAFQVLLYRYSDQDDFCVGTPIANRRHAELENLIGCFINTLVLRARISGQPAFRDFLHQVRETALQAYAHQDLPFEMLIDALQLERNLSHTPLFQVMFMLQNIDAGLIELPGLSIEQLDFDPGIAAFDLTLVMEETAEGLRGGFEYNCDIFEADTIQRMIGHFQQLLAAIVAAPEMRITELPLLAAAERRQLLLESNNTAAPFAHDRCVHELFAAQVARTPQNSALVFEETSLSYAELNAQANQLAHLLREQGVGPEQLVAIFLERSVEMVVAVLAVLKAGGAYLPLDAAYPRERITFMLADANPVLLISKAGLLAERLADEASLPPALLLDQAADQIAGQPTGEPLSGVTPANLAYVIYTSGSTGRPKGTLLEHRGLSNLAGVLLREFAIDEQSRVLQFAAFGFDASLTEFFMALLAGATLYLAPRETLVSPPDLLQLLREQRISTITLPPSLLAVLPDADLPALRTVASAGEACPPDVAARWAPGRRFLNGYGPTEATVAVSYYQVEQIDAQAATIPLGRPIANTRLYVLDRHVQPVPIGIPGELYIAGVGLARGYLNQPELTTERFIADPFSDVPGARLYKTGDLVRRRADGLFEYLGRSDHQVKIRGFRIELGEIEAALNAHPAVSNCVVLAREDAPGHRRLVAYLAPQDANADHAALTAELRRALQARLPDYMVPAVFQILGELPLTPNGKIDRKALAAAGAARAEPLAAPVAARNTSESLLAEIWCQVLGLEQVGIHDNFFEIGGDSILSIQVISRANQAGLQLGPRDLFQSPTIAGLASAAQNARSIDAEQGPVSGPAPLTPIQHWFFERDFANPNHWNQSLLLDVTPALDREYLEAAIEHLLEQHDVLRATVAASGADRQMQYRASRYELPLAWIHVAAPDAETGSIEAIAATAQTRFDLAQGPLIRFVYFDLGAQCSHRLLIVAHHLVIDAVSWRILLDDLQALYQQLVQGETPQLPPKTTSFKRWAERLAGYVESARSETGYWREIVALPPARLPHDLAGGPNRVASEQTLLVTLAAAETEQLLREAPRRYNAELNEILLSALALALSRWNGGRTQLIELEAHGREPLFTGVDVSRTIGWFTSAYPLALTLPAEREPLATLRAVKERVRAVPQRGVGYGILRYLSGDPALAAALRPAYPPEIGFNYLGQLDRGFAAATTSAFRPAREFAGAVSAAENERNHVLECTASIVDGTFALELAYSDNLHHRETIEHLARSFIQILRSFLDAEQPATGSTYTPSDFKLANLDQRKLDKVLARVGKSKKERPAS